MFGIYVLVQIDIHLSVDHTGQTPKPWAIIPKDVSIQT